MRAVFAVLSLLIVVVVVGLLAKKQLIGLSAAPASLQAPAAAPGAGPQSQSLQIQQQVRQTVEGAMQQARPMPDDQ